MSRLLDRIGDEVRRRAPNGSDDLRRASQRERLVVSAGNLRRRRSVTRRVALGGGAALTAAAALVIVWQVGEEPETFRCHSADGAAVSAHSWIDVGPDQPESLRFSDESQVELRAASRARLTRIDQSAVTVALETGDLHASIVSAPDRHWNFVAGPYRVMVTGTVLGVEWKPETRQLVVQVERGMVEVTGGALQQRTVEVVGGERLVVSNDGDDEAAVRLQRVEAVQLDDISPGAPVHPVPTDPIPFHESEATTATEMGDDVEADSIESFDDEPSLARSPRRRAVRRLHHHLRARQRREAVDAAQSIGVTAAAESLSASRIAQLAEYLRLEGQPDEAERILRRLRARYPADPEARRAAFVLGRLALDHTKYDRARHWFQTVLREAPRSSFAEEAFGRLIDTEVRAGHAAAARSAAEQYLSRYPQGSYRRVAEQLIGQPQNE